ncbi:helix-turn-helix domain-containing protein [Streptomyces sp. YC537]|uniref:Helix-turn-helix domain-containing protein n=1 Tax=Streptomyces boluensis TaxID=1775135 RepID=A0A964URJ7_9ACTN|nr:AraC family transcriptional regulator [Streptomyces boluensis]NBE54134.1 helix-turn-helix domain-containing protein [Streptomyces boluensis]
MAKDEWARLWQHEQLPGIDLLRARYVRHAFPRHSHEGYVFGAVSGGVEDVVLPDRTVHAMPGSVVMLNPEVPHAARAGVPEGWAYSTLYPSADVVAEIAAETTAIRGTVGFAEVDVLDPQGAHLIREVHRAAEEGNALAADSVLRLLVARLLSRYGSSLPSRTLPSAGCRNAARARAVLEERMAEPPSLEALATELGTSPFALLRAFKQQYGMPPHTWLTNARVRRARALLDAGTAPAEAAVAVGFTDQPHLNRHFTRIVGVPPGAYQRERRERGERGTVPVPLPLLAPGLDAPGTRVVRKNVQDRDEPLPVASEAWQNRHHPQLYAPETIPRTSRRTEPAPGPERHRAPATRRPPQDRA